MMVFTSTEWIAYQDDLFLSEMASGIDHSFRE